MQHLITGPLVQSQILGRGLVPAVRLRDQIWVPLD